MTIIDAQPDNITKTHVETVEVTEFAVNLLKQFDRKE